ncbi:hypothetical protein [Kordiimonas lacus]|uniref:Uncharacterized protein n=1 Tax=Kordiimonas lacus TaxID=637679 RepID=A0A1G7A630_9PROT|nr:hypothetical protein [Kordiimonas lacus]SDE10408.1 hypothetical protein SAMN04488071_2111 [Kordiimonas lacus]
MPFNMSETAVMVIYYAAFLGQIYLLSHYFPGRFIARVRYVIDNFPVKEYPKLYPNAGPNFAANMAGKLKLFRRVNNGIAIIGLLILAGMLGSGYRPDPLGGDEIFVMFYFFLQFIPFFIVAVKEHKQYKALRAAFKEARRTADLRPRHLFDFVSPVAVFAALVCFGAWLVYYLTVKGWDQPWEEEVYISVGMTTGMNLLYAWIIARFIYGKKLDPYQASKDYMKTVEAITKVLVYSSIGISLFHITTVAADEYALEAFDPVLTSLYMQYCVLIGFGVMLGTAKVEDFDFSVYREEGATDPGA